MTQIWLATSDDESAKVSGQYFFHRQPADYVKIADDVNLQDQFIKKCQEISGISL